MATIKAKVDGDKIIITMPFDKKGKPSKSMKSMNHATTNGSIELKADGFDKPLKVGINVYTPKED